MQAKLCGQKVNFVVQKKSIIVWLPEINLAEEEIFNRDKRSVLDNVSPDLVTRTSCTWDICEDYHDCP